jgi:hypothetical protein
VEYQARKSKCNLCQSEFKRQGLTRHIKSCLPKHLASETKPQRLLYLHIYDAYNPDYFLHLLLSQTTTLKNLDTYLRNIWLECCGHMSAFSRGRYGEEISMKHPADDILTPGTTLNYQYDFGSTTELTVKAIDYYDGILSGKNKIRLIARNDQPIIPCDVCAAKPAVEICTECQWEETGWLCEDCAQTHECDEEMLLPVVNSPRTGVCGYTGE